MGLQNYLERNKCQGYRVEISTSLSNYINYYIYSNNPIFVSINGHAVLGIGYSSLRKYSSDEKQSITNFMITHYDWRSRPGNFYATEELRQFFYIGNIKRKIHKYERKMEYPPICITPNQIQFRLILL